jgi:uncharacterized protein
MRARTSPQASRMKQAMDPAPDATDGADATAEPARPGSVPLLGDQAIAELLRSARRIAVIGASDRPGRPSHGVMADLLAAGYDVVPVTPASPSVLGVPASPGLAAAVAATGPFDIVDVFRRPEDCLVHAREAVVAGARVLWLQLGIENWDAARVAHDAGLGVVMDRCIAIDLRWFGRG